MTTPDNAVSVSQNIISFVDDNTLMVVCSPTATSELMHSCTTEVLASWQKIMDITGGVVELYKSFLSLMAFDFNTYSLRKHGRQRRIPVLKIVEQLPGSCVLTGNDNNPVALQKVQPTSDLNPFLKTNLTIWGASVTESPLLTGQVRYLQIL